jgi:hypothetical protein
VNDSENSQAFGMTAFVRVERVNEHACVDRVSEPVRSDRSTRMPRSPGSGAHSYRRIVERRRTPPTPRRNRCSRQTPALTKLAQAVAESSADCESFAEGSSGRITPIARPRCVRIYDSRESLTWRKMCAALAFNSRTPTSFWVARPRAEATDCAMWSLMWLHYRRCFPSDQDPDQDE